MPVAERAGPSYRHHARGSRQTTPTTSTKASARSADSIGTGGVGARPEWNPSTVDETHPFPQRALNHTAVHYAGVDVVDTHFPAAVKGTARLRRGGDPRGQPGVWSANVTRARASNRYTFASTCAALRTGEGAMNGGRDQSYLASVIVEENTPEKRRLRQGWCSRSTLDDHVRNRHVAAPRETVDYLTVNKSKPELAAALADHYVTPKQRVEARYQHQQQDATLRRLAAAETPTTLFERPDAPAVFKISNIDSWWGLDPVRVAAEQTTLKEALRGNPYSSFHRRGNGGTV